MKYLFILLLLSSCIPMKKYRAHTRAYQIALHMDTVWIYDKSRLVGRFIHYNDSTAWENAYDSILTKDNQ